MEFVAASMVITQSQDCLRQVQQVLACFREAKRLAAECTDKPRPVVRVQQVFSDPVRAEIEQALNREVPRSVRETPLQEVIAFLRDRTKTNILIDVKALDDIGVGTGVKCLSAPGCLAIQHTAAVHRQVSDLLAQLNVVPIRQASVPPAAGLGGGIF